MHKFHKQGVTHLASVRCSLYFCISYDFFILDSPDRCLWFDKAVKELWNSASALFPKFSEKGI